MTKKTKNNTAKKTFWTLAVFYFLIGFEFFYMASPFAMYFYSIYGTGLDFIQDNAVLSWLSSLFLPHIVKETKSIMIDLLDELGAIIFISGFLAFCFGAVQVYYNKFTKKGAVTGGIYKIIRHPQYTAFAISGFGLLILWPRYIVLFIYIAMLIIYYFLAKAEEYECEKKFGQSYIDYKNKTNMFLPIKIKLFKGFIKIPIIGFKKVILIISTYLVLILISLGMAYGLQRASINSLYALYTEDSVYISLLKLDDATIGKLNNIALTNKEVQKKLMEEQNVTGTKFINYILPSDWYVHEILMSRVANMKREGGHYYPSDYNKNLFRIVFTKTQLNKFTNNIEGKKILSKTVKRTPVIEVLIDLSKNEVIGIKESIIFENYKNIPMPSF